MGRWNPCIPRLHGVCSFGWHTAESMAQSFPILTLEQIYGAITLYLAHRLVIEAYLRCEEAAFETMRQGWRAQDPMFHQKMAAARGQRQNIYVLAKMFFDRPVPGSAGVPPASEAAKMAALPGKIRERIHFHRYVDVRCIHARPVLQGLPWERHAPAWLPEAGLEPGVPRLAPLHVLLESEGNSH